MRIVIFGAGGRAGRRIVAEAEARGHEVTAATREVADVTDAPPRWRRWPPGRTRSSWPPRSSTSGLLPPRRRGLIDGLTKAGTDRLVVIGIGTSAGDGGVRPLHRTPGFLEDARTFSEGHADELELLRGGRTSTGWSSPRRRSSCTTTRRPAGSGGRLASAGRRVVRVRRPGRWPCSTRWNRPATTGTAWRSRRSRVAW